MNAVRSTGARNLVAVPGSRSWGRFADGFVAHPIVDTNWAAGIHSYLHPNEFDGGFRYCLVRAIDGWVPCVGGWVGHFLPLTCLLEHPHFCWRAGGWVACLCGQCPFSHMPIFSI